MDYGISYTDKQAKVLEKHIRSIYTEAKKDINGKLKDFNARFKVKDAKHKADLKAGLITKEEYQSWLKGQVFQGDHWKQMRTQMESILTHANEEAINIVNGGKISVIANNANYMAYTLEHGAGVNFGFALYDRSTVTNLLKEQPDLLPNKHIDPVKDGKWNRKKITRQVTLGILEGESTDQVADRLANVLSSQDQNAMLTTARTAMTGAQNVGRQLRMEEAAKKGIKLHKEWMCTLDLHTRIAHRELDGQKVPVDKPFKVDGYEIRFPADPQAEAYLVYNCFTEDVDVATNCEIVRSYRHMYEGKLYKFKTVNGVEFTCTPNHPILTSSGWVRAEMLHEGDDILVTGIGNTSGIRRNGNINKIHSRFVALFNAFHRFGLMSRDTTLSVNFHGDIPASNVEIITKEWLLRNDRDVCGGKRINKFLLKLSDTSFVCLGTFVKHFGRVSESTFRFVSRKCKSLSFIGGRVSHTDVHGFGAVSDGNVGVAKYTINDLPAETVLRSELVNGLPREVLVDHIVDVDIFMDKCHVYNLQTENGYYFVNSSISQNKELYNGMYAITRNCRCTMVADLDDYPSVYQRYDNIDGVPVDQMTYSEWYKAKGFTDKKAKGIDYSEFGGKDVYDIFIKYKDMADWMLNAPTDEQLAIMSVSTDNVELKELFAKAHANEAKMLAENSNIAKDVIDYSEFGGKANYEIMNKYKDFEDWIAYSDPDDFFPINDLIEDGGIDKVKLLFEKAHTANVKSSTATKVGLTSKKVDITSETQVASIKPQNAVEVDQSKYTQEAKDNAKWAKGSVQADDFYYDEGEAQINALAEYKQEAIYDYTSDSYRYNSPFYGIWDKDRLDEFDIDELPMKRESIKDLTKALNECHLESDRWLQRGTGYSEMESFFGVDIRNMSDEELEGLIGQSGRLMSFTSCGSAKGTGFTDQKVILNIYTPEGTKATYVEPISCFKGGNERETLIQRGGYYVPTKFERTWNTLYIDFEHHPEKGYLTIGQ